MSVPYNIKSMVELIKVWHKYIPVDNDLHWKIISLTGEKFDMLMVNGVEIRKISRESISHL